MTDAALLFVRGLAMGAADVVPGVSGGTIAFITGIYERFIAALRSLSLRFVVLLFRGKVGEARRALGRVHWWVLGPMLAGIGIAMLTMSTFITGMMEDRPGPTYAFFFGLILASSWMPLARVKRYSNWNVWAMMLSIFMAWSFVGAQGSGTELEQARPIARDRHADILYAQPIRTPDDFDGVIAWAATHRPDELTQGFLDSLRRNEQWFRLTVFDPENVLGYSEESDVARYLYFRETAVRLTILRTRDQLNEWLDGDPNLLVLRPTRATLPFVFVSGALAISAMILPGLSGSFLLLVLGQYHAVFTTMHRCVGYLTGQSSTDPLVALSGVSFADDWIFIGVFGLGLLVGLAVFSRVVNWLLHSAHDVTMAALTGLMVGALRQPGGEVLNAASDMSIGGYWGIAVAAALSGAIIVLTLHFVDVRMRMRHSVQGK